MQRSLTLFMSLFVVVLVSSRTSFGLDEKVEIDNQSSYDVMLEIPGYYGPQKTDDWILAKSKFVWEPWRGQPGAALTQIIDGGAGKLFVEKAHGQRKKHEVLFSASRETSFGWQPYPEDKKEIHVNVSNPSYRAYWKVIITEQACEKSDCFTVECKVAETKCGNKCCASGQLCQKERCNAPTPDNWLLEMNCKECLRYKSSTISGVRKCLEGRDYHASSWPYHQRVIDNVSLSIPDVCLPYLP